MRSRRKYLTENIAKTFAFFIKKSINTSTIYSVSNGVTFNVLDIFNGAICCNVLMALTCLSKIISCNKYFSLDTYHSVYYLFTYVLKRLCYKQKDFT